MAIDGTFRPLIFISHSAREDIEAYTSLEIIRDHLKENGFEVLIDETTIKGGDEWYEFINTWLAHCHGAIILLTAKALNSPWVLKEAAILSWRRSRSPPNEFKLLPVLLGISASDVKNSKEFGVLELSDYQALMNLKRLPLAKKLAGLLDPLRSRQLMSPRQEAEEKLAFWLQGLTTQPSLLERVITLIGEDIGGWDPNKNLAGRAAMLLLQAPLERIVGANALQPLRGVLPDDALAKIVDMLRASWIDIMTASKFMEVAGRPEGMRAAALNGSAMDFTEMSLFARAHGGYPYWRFLKLGDAPGEDQHGSFVAQIDEWLKKLTRAKDQAGMLRAIKDFVQTNPILIVLPPIDEHAPLPDEDEINQLLEQYPYCTFFVLSGAKPLAPENLKKFVRLVPELEKEKEGEALSKFHALQMQTGY